MLAPTVVMAEQLLTTDRGLEGVTFFIKPGVGQGFGYRQGVKPDRLG